MPAGNWITTGRVELRPPTREDLADYVRLHTDPRSDLHEPAAMPTIPECDHRFAETLERWSSEGMDHAPVRDRDTGEVVGWAGLRVVRGRGPRSLSLYIRLQSSSQGRGLGREVARALARWATEHRADAPLRAVVAPGQAASLATCRAAGLVEVGREVHACHPDHEPDIVLEAPRVDSLARAQDAPVDEVVDLWRRVNDAGGAVGFLPGAPVARVREAYERHAELLGAGRAVLVLLRDPDQTLRGLGFWEHGRGFPHAHSALLKRFMVDPTARDRPLGSLLLAGMVGVARRELPGISLLRLEYRSGLGLGQFYARGGWSEVGRVPGGLWLGGDDRRDEVHMARRVDGRPLVADGRT